MKSVEARLTNVLDAAQRVAADVQPHLRADPVGAGHEDGVVDARRIETEQTAERSDLREDSGSERASRERSNAPDNFVAGWKKSDPPKRFTEADLYGYIDGGAELVEPRAERVFVPPAPGDSGGASATREAASNGRWNSPAKKWHRLSRAALSKRSAV